MWYIYIYYTLIGSANQASISELNDQTTFYFSTKFQRHVILSGSHDSKTIIKNEFDHVFPEMFLGYLGFGPWSWLAWEKVMTIMAQNLQNYA